MKIIYTDTPKQAKQGEVYRRLGHFFGVIGGATSVVIEGDAPHIAKAYKKAGVTVNAAQEKESEKTQGSKDSDGDLKTLKVPELKALAEEQGIEFASNATKTQLVELLAAEQDAEE